MESSLNNYGYVFNIQQFSVHDGPGIRTIVFLKGCPLRCEWCSNPESQQCRPELAYNINKCIGILQCGRCLSVCPQQAISADENDKPAIRRVSCEKCFCCTQACPTTALSAFGQPMSVEEVLQIIERDSVFYSRSGGGLTLSGGEPLMQAGFAVEVLKEAKRRRVNTAIETSGYAAWSDLKSVCQYLNTIIYDIKCLDANKHKERTKQSNEIILDNFKKIAEEFPNLPILVRTPVIPGFNDTAEDIMAIIDFITGRSNLRYELLPYHRLGQPKYEYLGNEYSLGGISLSDERMKKLQELVPDCFRL